MPRAFRAQGTNAASSRELRNLLDGVLLGRYAQLSIEEQRKLAMQIGSTPGKVAEALAELSSGLP